MVNELKVMERVDDTIQTFIQNEHEHNALVKELNDKLWDDVVTTGIREDDDIPNNVDVNDIDCDVTVELNIGIDEAVEQFIHYSGDHEDIEMMNDTQLFEEVTEYFISQNPNSLSYVLEIKSDIEDLNIITHDTILEGFNRFFNESSFDDSKSIVESYAERDVIEEKVLDVAEDEGGLSRSINDVEYEVSSIHVNELTDSLLDEIEMNIISGGYTIDQYFESDAFLEYAFDRKIIDFDIKLVDYDDIS